MLIYDPLGACTGRVHINYVNKWVYKVNIKLSEVYKIILLSESLC